MNNKRKMKKKRCSLAGGGDWGKEERKEGREDGREGGRPTVFAHVIPLLFGESWDAGQPLTNPLQFSCST
jgi:hypothetical protein